LLDREHQTLRYKPILMSKTNQRRGFSGQKDSERYRASPAGHAGENSVLADKSIGARWGGDNTDGHQGHAKAKRGAKKFVRTRIRFHENQATKRLADAANLAREPSPTSSSLELDGGFV
jgi:hypothetical protein